MAEIGALGVPCTHFLYDAGHAFFNDTRPVAYHAESAALAWERALGFLREQLSVKASRAALLALAVLSAACARRAPVETGAAAQAGGPCGCCSSTTCTSPTPARRQRRAGARGGVARFGAGRSGERVLFLMAGDLFSPSLLSKWYQGRQMVQAMNAAGVDYATLGNHEFDVDRVTVRGAHRRIPRRPGCRPTAASATAPPFRACAGGTRSRCTARAWGSSAPRWRRSTARGCAAPMPTRPRARPWTRCSPSARSWWWGSRTSSCGTTAPRSSARSADPAAARRA